MADPWNMDWSVRTQPAVEVSKPWEHDWSKEPEGPSRLSVQSYMSKIPKHEEPAVVGGIVAAGKAVASDVAGLGDMITAIPGMAWGLGRAGAQYLDALATGKSHKEASVLAEKEYEQSVDVPATTGMFTKAMRAAGFEEPYSKSDVDKVMGHVDDLVKKGGGWVEHLTGGAVTKEDVQLATNTAMLALGAKGAGEGLNALTKVKEAGAPAETAAAQHLEELERLGKGEQAPTEPPAAKELAGKSDAEINAERQAYALMQEGASLKRVQAAIKKNPLVGEKLSEFMQRREEVLKGPMSRVLQGEVLDPAKLEAKAETLDQTKRLPGQNSMLPHEELEPPRRFSEKQNTPYEQKIRTQEEEAWEARKAAEAKERYTDEMHQKETLSNKEYEGAKLGGGRAARFQSGQANLDLLLKIGVTTAGAAAGGYLADTEKLEGAIAGGALGLMATLLPKAIRNANSMWADVAKPILTTAAISGGLAALYKDDPMLGALVGLAWGARGYVPKANIPASKINGKHMTLDDVANLHNGTIESMNRIVNGVRDGIKALVPTLARREALSRAVDTGNFKGLSVPEIKAANIYKGFTKQFGELAKNVGVLEDLATNYVSYVIDANGAPKGKLQEVMEALGFNQVRPDFAKRGKYSTFDELNKAIEGTGLHVHTMDLAQIADIYGKSMNRAIAHKRYVEGLKQGKTSGGDSWVAYGDKVPPGYEYVNSAYTRGMHWHPDVADSMKVILGRGPDNLIARGVMALSSASKRITFVGNMFHNMTLAIAHVGAGGKLPLFGMKGELDAALRQLREGGLGDVVDIGLKNGLKVVNAAPEEAGRNALAALGGIGDELISQAAGYNITLFRPAGKSLETVQTKVFDRFTWDYMHPGMKIATFVKEYEKGLVKYPDMSKEQVAASVAKYVNDIYGGIDWYRVATEAKGVLGRKVGLALASPSGRAMMQLALLAPDWTFSTFRSIYKALPGTEGDPLTKSLYRKYVMRAGAAYFVIANGLNQATAGHWLWENRDKKGRLDPFDIDLGDGTKWSIAKHFTEAFKDLQDPGQAILNKLGPVPKEVFEQLLHKEYIVAAGSGGPAMQGGRLGHVAQNALPLILRQQPVPGRSPEESVKRTLSEFVGLPVYGMTKQEVEESQEEKRRKRKEAQP